jgi:hypothetical protein
METMVTVLGEEHPDTLTIMHNLALTWKGQGHDMKAAKLMEDCVRLRTQVLGAHHPDTLATSATLDEWRLGDAVMDDNA